MFLDEFASARNLRRHRATLAPIAAGLALLAGLLASAAAPARAAPAGQGGTEGQAIFQSRCTACHTIGQGTLVGPDLKDIGARREAGWLRSFISEPDALFAANDPTAQQLLQEFNDIKMPAPGLSDAELDAVIAYLSGPDAASGSGTAPAAQEAAQAGDPSAGQLFFTGEMALGNGGQACIACHSVRGAGGLGGALGPDLTHVVQRYGETGLTAALANIAFPTMVGPFANRSLSPWERASLIAYLKRADQQQPAALVQAGAITASTGWFVGIGLAGAIALSAILLAFWRPQRQSISSRLREKGGSGRA